MMMSPRGVCKECGYTDINACILTADQENKIVESLLSKEFVQSDEDMQKIADDIDWNSLLGLTEEGTPIWANEKHDLCSTCYEKARRVISMTQIQKWGNVELNRALAEKMGYSVTTNQGYWLKKPDGTMYANPFSKNTEEIAWSWAPDYVGDPAASLKVQAAAYAASPEWYLHYLAMRTNKEDLSLDEFPDSFEVFGPELVGPMITAEPRERAEAAYMVLNQNWEQ